MKNLLIERNEGVASITINREKALNALNSETLKELKDLLIDIENDSSIKVVILTGAGDKAFVAGADISEMQDCDTITAYEFSKLGQGCFDLIEKSSKFYIAAINGYALGGGLELSLACDVRLASEKARFAIPEVSLGVIPGFGGTQRLSKVINVGRAKQMLATAEMIDANKAEAWGLVNEVYKADELIDIANEMAKKILKNSLYAISVGKEAINQSSQIKLEDGLELEALIFAKTFSHPDQKEGMTAFIEKRKANFK